MLEKNSPILIQGGRILDPSREGAKKDFIGDLLIENGKIAISDTKIPTEKILKIQNLRKISAHGKWVLHGFIDVHTHLRDPGYEYKETLASGTRAAVAGGFTSVACMANTKPVNDTPYVTAFIREHAKTTASCKVFPIGAISKGLAGELLAEIGGMVREGAVAISDDGVSVMNSYLMRKAMDYSKAFGIPVISHAEDMNLVGQSVMNESALSNELGLRGNPAAAEEIMVARDIALCRLTRCPVHFAHITTRIALDHIRRAKEAGLPVTAEVTPHHLILSENNIRSYLTNYKMSPPLRSEEDVKALREALSTGLIDMIATDHAPHGLIDKAMEFDQAANGVIGLETAVPLTLKLVREGVLSLQKWIESLTLQPAKLLKLDAGTLREGANADVTVFDPEKIWTFTEENIQSKSKNSPFIGNELKGQIVFTLVNGKIVYEI